MICKKCLVWRPRPGRCLSRAPPRGRAKDLASADIRRNLADGVSGAGRAAEDAAGPAFVNWWGSAHRVQVLGGL